MANTLPEDGVEEGVAIAMGFKQAGLFFRNQEKKGTDQPVSYK